MTHYICGHLSFGSENLFSSIGNSRKGEDVLKRLTSVGAVEASRIDRVVDILYEKKLAKF